MIFLSPGEVPYENNEKFEFDDLLTEHDRFLRSQGLQTKAKIVPERPERRKRGSGAQFFALRGRLGTSKWSCRGLRVTLSRVKGGNVDVGWGGGGHKSTTWGL